MSYYDDFLKLCVGYLKILGITKETIDEYETEGNGNDFWTFIASDEDVAEQYGEYRYGVLQTAMEEDMYNSGIKPSKNEVLDYISDFSLDDFVDMVNNAPDQYYETLPELLEKFNIHSDDDFQNAVRNNPEMYEFVEDVFINSVCFGFPDEDMQFFNFQSSIYDDIYNNL